MVTEFDFSSTFESLKAALTSASTLLLSWVFSLMCDFYNNYVILVVPLMLVILDSLFAVIRVKILHAGGFESRKFSKSVGKLIIYYVAILSGWCIDVLLADANIVIVCDRTISWTICAFLSIGEVVSILASLVVLFPHNLGAKLLLRVFRSEIASKLSKWGVDDEYLKTEVEVLTEAAKAKVEKRKVTKKSKSSK